MKSLVRRNIFVQIGPIIIIIRILIILIVHHHFIAKNPGLLNPKCPIPYLELLTGPINEIQRKYEILSDIVITQYNGKVHGSQRGQDPRTGQLIDLLVYYEVPLGMRDEVKQKFNNKNKSVYILDS
ncbi:MAG TPA: hypothetical protein VF047_00940 [Nitrososphaeraceae archaeon]